MTSRRGQDYLEDRGDPPHVAEAGPEVLTRGDEECEEWDPKTEREQQKLDHKHRYSERKGVNDRC